MTTNEQEVDEIARAAWTSVYDGNVADMKQVIDAFFTKYDEHIYTAGEYQVGPLKWEDIKQECARNSKSAGGLDIWTKRELSWLSDSAYKWLTRWLMMVEETRTWPRPQTMTRAAFLCKDVDNPGIQ